MDTFLTFDDAVRQHSFPVTIINDPLFEPDVEDFALELRFDPFALEIPANVILNPNVSTEIIVLVRAETNYNNNISYYPVQLL